MNYNNEKDNRNKDYNRHDSRNRFKRRRRRDFFRRFRGEKQELLRCPICERDITELPSAITHRETGHPAHFDCIMKGIEQAEAISQNEKICYLGKGSFGIVRFQKIGGSIPFVIRKRIQYEDLEETPPWRKQLDRFSPKEPRAQQ